MRGSASVRVVRGLLWGAVGGNFRALPCLSVVNLGGGAGVCVCPRGPRFIMGGVRGNFRAIPCFSVVNLGGGGAWC